ncbi:hypothetical protein QWT87_16970 [Chryseobacterium sp. APV1]|uniref:C1q domain-containing protein n=1 Tax=Chryseobacterium urinae TaxID=3058400 RepID=A0ABT8U682_9FLAO|nr:hypothetical protein [Chryseobacterium sp. APV1]MDO3426574.1 hypothetical protein [Chryseobacterium sp. APV1]
MKNKTIIMIMIGILLPLLSFSQVGVNNANPQGTFHVDGAKDNPALGVPSASQQLNDFTVANDGKVGIGTSTPNTKLTITTPDNSFGINNTNGTISLRSYLGGGAASFGTTTLHDFKLQTNGTSRIMVTSNGNVGINNDLPTETLDVKGNISLSSNEGGASSIKFYENSTKGVNKVTVIAPDELILDRTFTLPSNDPVPGQVLMVAAGGNTRWAPILSPTSNSFASIAYKTPNNEKVDVNPPANAILSLRFFQKFDTTVTDPNNVFNVTNGTYTAPVTGNYLITAYIVPNAAPAINTPNYYYPVNLEIRKNCTSGNPSSGINIIDTSTIRYATPDLTLRYTLGLNGMVALNEGDTLNLVVFLSGFNVTSAAFPNGGQSFPPEFTYSTGVAHKAFFSVTAL